MEFRERSTQDCCRRKNQLQKGQYMKVYMHYIFIAHTQFENCGFYTVGVVVSAIFLGLLLFCIVFRHIFRVYNDSVCWNFSSHSLLFVLFNYSSRGKLYFAESFVGFIYEATTLGPLMMMMEVWGWPIRSMSTWSAQWIHQWKLIVSSFFGFALCVFFCYCYFHCCFPLNTSK